ncbi:DUF1043 family protein [uncultured Agitococcus sp.]|uniref:YhcB family protein n=1 Tax=uncultured Agitococcus sp. TaxID=1506599 RepID=UPI002622985F|nr:DUF1043 family protein [uncultured Agitococcus sp.]
MEWLLYIGLIAIGFIGGYVFQIYRNSDSRVRDLESHLHDLQGKYESYQESVTSHFSHSAQLVNNLTNAYREVHEHLQKGAHELCADNKRHTSNNPATAFLGLEATKESFPQAAGSYENKFLEPLEPPRDYAPKNANDKGMLDEEYGFK